MPFATPPTFTAIAAGFPAADSLARDVAIELTDALALLDLDTGLVHGMARPIGLRNGAIAAARGAAPGLRFTPEVGDAALGTAALACPPTDSVSRMHEPAWPAWLLLLQPQPQQATEIEPQGAADSFMQLASDALNYALHGRRGFEGLGDLIDHCSCHRLRYRTLAEGADAIDSLAAQPPCPAARAC